MATSAVQRILDDEWTSTEAIIGAYGDLVMEQARALASIAVEIIELPSSMPKRRLWAATALMRLACMVPGSLAGMHHRLLDQRVLSDDGFPLGLDHLGVLFHRADAGARDRLLAMIDSAPAHAGVVAAFAWVDDDVVRAAFTRWATAPPAWAAEPRWQNGGWLALFPPEAGWTLSDDGGRRALYSWDCLRLSSNGDGAVASVGGPDDAQSCPWCENPLTILLDLRVGDPALRFLGINRDRIRIPTCELCGCRTTLYMDIDADGEGSWSQLNVRPERLVLERYDDHMVQGVRKLGKPRLSPFEATAFGWDVFDWDASYSRQGGAEESSQLGGAPTWIQDAEYPSCPRCDQLMRFIGQVDTSKVAWGEGTIYVFLDADCMMAATSYQQT